MGGMRRNRSAARAATLMVTMLLAACAPAGGGGTPASPSTPLVTGIAHPVGADEAVLTMGYEGGLVAVEFHFGTVPALLIAGDGTVVVPGAQDAIFPGAALSPLQTRKLSEAGVQLVLERLAQTGFFATDADFSGAQLGVADASSTVFTMHADGRDVRVSVYALGLLDSGDPPPGMDERERLAHTVLGKLAQDLGALEQLIPASAWEETAWHPYIGDQLRLLVANADAEPADPSGIPAPDVAWPAGGDPATFGAPYPPLDASRCGVVSGTDAGAWYAALAEANQLTRFTAGGHRYRVSVRPILPGEDAACPAR